MKPRKDALSHNVETERSLLGGLLIAPQMLGDVDAIIRADDFARPPHQVLYGMMLAMHGVGRPPDLVMLLDEAERRNEIDRIGGHAYILDLTNACPSVSNLPHYAVLVRDHAIRRRLQLVGAGIVESVKDGTASVDALIDQAQSSIMAVTRTDAVKGWRSMSDAVSAQMAEIARRQANPGEVVGVTTGFRELDRMLAGLHHGNLVLVAGRPGSGKTLLGLNIAHAAAASGVGVGVFSLEMSEGELVGRMLTASGRVHADNIRTGRLDPVTDWPRLGTAAEHLHQLPIWIDDATGLTIAQLRNKAKRLKAEHPNLGLIVVDYLQLMQGDGANKQENRENIVAGICRGMKILAKELGLPLVCLAQLNRQCETRQDKRPMASDLRETGAAEQDADVIVMIYRDEMYDPMSPDKGTAEILIRKQRGGSIGMVRLAFQGEYSLFSDLAHPSHDYQ